MTPISSKPLDRITAEDINRLIAEAPPEGGSLEFKEALPARDGLDVAWSEKSEVTPFARNKLLQEVVAFANAYGGDLVVGVQESQEKPPRAAGLAPLANCADLAERLRLQARDCIEPQIPLLHAVGVPLDTNGCGVVVVRVPQSRMAPHRLRSDNECYIRRADRTEKMTMREIQDLTLRLERGLARLEDRFQRAAASFVEEMSALRLRSGEDVVGMRATLLPVGVDLYIPKVYARAELAPHGETLPARSGDGRPFPLTFPASTGRPRPILRGARYVSDHDVGWDRQEIGADGRVEYAMLWAASTEPAQSIPPGWVVSSVANAMLTAHAFRVAAGAPDAEYGLEVELAITQGTIRLGGWDERRLLRGTERDLGKSVLFPRYSVGPYHEFAGVTEALVLDLYNAAAEDLRQSFRVEFPAQER